MKTLLTPICLLLGLSLSLIPTIASAQSAGNFGNNSDNRDPFSRASTGDTSGLLNLLNQAQLNSQKNPTYGTERDAEMNSATNDFRARQLQVLRERNKKGTPAPVVAPKN
jgi:hypothetical protein